MKNKKPSSLLSSRNERVTEDIVREKFRSDKIAGRADVWEQMPEDEIVKKCLASASKSSGSHPGRPEFIIRSKSHPNFLIVVECKSDISMHESGSRDADVMKYAVDGAIHYAKALSRKFNVLAIAVSGAQPLRVSHYWVFKGENAHVSCFGDDLLSLEDYCAAYAGHGKVFNQDLGELLLYTKELNKQLHFYKIKEAHRSLLISAILLSLQNEAFRASYTSESSGELLMSRIRDNMFDSMEKGGIEHAALGNIKGSYGFMGDVSELKKDNNLANLVSGIDERLNSFQRTHEYHDILGRLYVEFLRYSNSDKGLGIVLTPPHITQLAAKLLNPSPADVLYDNCAGTGGFLVSGMKEMIAAAKGNLEQIEQVKAKGLIGLEIQADLVSLLYSNMFIHGDGRSNVIKGDCFNLNADHQAKIKARGPTMGFLNPPFRKDAGDKEEFEFVLNNLEYIQSGGQCAALLPMSCALVVDDGVRGALKKKLLERHTLEAVLSLPDEIFSDNNVGVVTCLMIFTAHKPHPDDKKTWFGYCKDDGFQKKKPHGRIDSNHKWDGLRDSWLTNYRNKTVKPGFSEMRHVNYSDEWCAESYLETDYEVTSPDFGETVKNHQIYLLNSAPTPCADAAVDKGRMKPSKWEWVPLPSLFNIQGTRTTSREMLEIYGTGDYPYVTTQAVNNGVAGFYNHWTEEGCVITVDSAVLGFASYQGTNFSASDHVEKLIPKFSINRNIAAFIVTLLNREQYRYNYGRKCSQSRMRGVSIKLPVIRRGGDVDFDFMDKYMESIFKNFPIGR